MASNVWDGTCDPVATEVDIISCFRLLLGRRPNKQEWPGHSLNAGKDLSAVVAEFLSSREFANRRLLRRDPEDLRICDLDKFAMYLSPKDIDVGQTIAATRSYEPHVTRELVKRLSPGSVFLDIGANIGYFSLLAASIVGKGGKVIAVEPNSRNAKALHASRERNGFSNLEILQIAASSSWEMLFLDAAHSNGSVSFPVGDISELLARETVMSLPLDVVLDHDQVDLIKIDVEGFEFRALSGMVKCIDRDRPTIISEFSPGSLPGSSGVTPLDYLDFFKSRGYRLAVIGLDELLPCGDAAEVMALYYANGTDHIDILAEA
jgi:FkbM family methyltransferase